MTTVQLEAAIRKEAEKNKRKLADLDAKLAGALVVGHWKDAEKFKRKIADEADRHAEKAAKLRAKLDAEANALGVVGMRHTGDAPLPLETIAQDLGTIADWNARAAEPAVRVTHGWLWGYFEPIGTAFKAREWKRAAGLVVLRLLLPAIPCIIALNALKGCMGLNN